MARRFIVNKEDCIDIDDTYLKIKGNEVKHIQVLRFNLDDIIIINNLVCKIIKIKRDNILLERLNIADKMGEPTVSLTLYIALLKTDKLDLVVQKATELGVKKIVPFISNNVIVKLDDKSKVKRKEKLQVIANEACKQCGRTDTVLINDILNFEEFKQNLDSNDLILFAYEHATQSLKSTVDTKYINIGAIVGCEGGFTETEAKQISSISNIKQISLGQRILRAETARNKLSFNYYV